MKTTQILAVLGFAAIGMAQVLPPSPTESVGCEAHGDHWHCDGPASTSAGGATTPAVTSAPTTTTTAPVTTTTTSAHHDDDDEHDHEHDHGSGTASLPPSPTASVGCEPHGDHWHCDGPRTTLAPTGSGSNGTSTSSSTSSTATGGAASHGVSFGAGALAIFGAIFAI